MLRQARRRDVCPSYIPQAIEALCGVVGVLLYRPCNGMFFTNVLPQVRFHLTEAYVPGALV